MISSSAASSKMTSSAFSSFVKDVKDLYNLALRNGFYLPQQSSSAVNEVMLLNVLQGHYWCPLFKDIKLKPCVKAPVKEVLLNALLKLCRRHMLNVAWIDEKHSPDKDWIVAVLSTLDPNHEIFKKDYVAPPVRRRLQDVETIVLPNELFDGLPLRMSSVALIHDR